VKRAIVLIIVIAVAAGGGIWWYHQHNSAAQHDGASRRQVVACTPTGRDITSFVEEAKKQVEARVKFPKGVYAVFGGNAEAAAQAQLELLIHSAIAGAGIFLC
jgi:Cu/Ag efflux pump CusA